MRRAVGGMFKAMQEAYMENVTTPRYLKIAADLAARIGSGRIGEGEQLKGRSVLSSEYNVSPETIRRAMSLLADKQVVAVKGGSGITVLSRENALQFVKSFQEESALPRLRGELEQLLERRSSLDGEIAGLTNRLLDLYKFRRSDLFTPVEVSLPADSFVLGKSIGTLQIWHNTGATILGIVRENRIIISPGPYYEFTKGDRVVIVGDENVIERFNAFVNGFAIYIQK